MQFNIAPQFVVYWQLGLVAPSPMQMARQSIGFDSYILAEAYVVGLEVTHGPQNFAHLYIESSDDASQGDTAAVDYFAEQIVLFATNTGDWYKSHQRRAARGDNLGCWQDWVRRVVLPRWQRECGALPGLASPQAVLETARQLRDYYQRELADERAYRAECRDHAPVIFG